MNQRQDQGFNAYESIEFNLATGQTSYALAANQAGFLSVFGPEDQRINNTQGTHNGRYPSYVLIRTNTTITVSINAAANQAITITSTDSPFAIVGIQIKDLFFTNNSGSTAAIKLLFLDNPN